MEVGTTVLQAEGNQDSGNHPLRPTPARQRVNWSVTAVHALTAGIYRNSVLPQLAASLRVQIQNLSRGRQHAPPVHTPDK